MREKIARAIHSRTLGDWDFLDPIYQAAYLEQADAALDALMEATEGMLDSGVAFDLNVSLGGGYRWTDKSRDHHRAMIQTARDGK